MIKITPCKDRIDELVHFVTRLNSDGTHYIGFFGEGEADVRISLAECLIPPSEGFMLAYDDDQLVGIFGVDADAEVNKAWLYGPLVEYADWHLVADQLYEAVLPLIPVNIRDRILFCDVRNLHMEEFAGRGGFRLAEDSAILRLRRD